MPRKVKQSKYAFHPLKQWMDANSVSSNGLSQLVSAQGWPLTVGYATAIRNGHRNPSYELAEILERITGVPVRVFMLWKPVPLRRVRAAS